MQMISSDQAPVGRYMMQVNILHAIPPVLSYLQAVTNGTHVQEVEGEVEPNLMISSDYVVQLPLSD